jgi:hypothetical protein
LLHSITLTPDPVLSRIRTSISDFEKQSGGCYDMEKVPMGNHSAAALILIGKFGMIFRDSGTGFLFKHAKQMA